MRRTGAQKLCDPKRCQLQEKLDLAQRLTRLTVLLQVPIDLDFRPKITQDTLVHKLDLKGKRAARIVSAWRGAMALDGMMNIEMGALKWDCGTDRERLAVAKSLAVEQALELAVVDLTEQLDEAFVPGAAAGREACGVKHCSDGLVRL